MERRDATPPGPSLKSAVLRAALFLALLLGAFAAARWTPLAEWLDKDQLVERLLFYRQQTWAAPALIGLFTLFGLVGLPVSPLIFAGAVVFGPVWGWLTSLVGCVLGASASFGLARWLGSALVRRLIGEHRYAWMMSLWKEHGFWTVFRIRFLPVPFPVVNYGAALAGLSFPTYFAGSILGMTMSVGVYNYLFSTLFEAASGERTQLIVKGVTAILALLALTFVPTLLRRRRRVTSEPDR